VLFVVRYHQFRAAMDEQRYGDAGQTLIKMFRDGIVPMEHRNRWVARPVVFRCLCDEQWPRAIGEYGRAGGRL
jgi:hypothetical protein